MGEQSVKEVKKRGRCMVKRGVGMGEKRVKRGVGVCMGEKRGRHGLKRG